MTTEQVIEWIVAIVPSVISILTTIGVIIKVVKEFAQLKAQVIDMKSIEGLKEELRMVLQENMQLKQTLNKTLTKIDHVQRDNANEIRNHKKI